MKLRTTLASSAILLLPSLAKAASLTSFCLTYYSATPTTPIPTSTYTATTTSTRTITSTSTPVTTVTPVSATTTKTVTSTIKTTVTLSKTTDTYTSTTTFSSTATATSTSTSTTTNTVTTTFTNTDPVTATPSPDFTPLASELAAGGYSAGACPAPSTSSAAPTPVKRGTRDIFAALPDSIHKLLPRQVSSGAPGTATYPTSVGCTTLYYATSTSTVTATASTTSTKSLKQGTVVSTTTVTTTSTSTKVPTSVKLTVVSTTTTVTSTATVTATTGTATTTTTTAYQPASTVYPACQSDNIVECANGYQLANPSFTYNLYEISGPTDAQSCCIACSVQQGCGGSFYSLWAGASACYGVIDNGVCEGNNSYASFQVQAGSYAPYVYSNSNCGRWGIRPADS